MSNNRNVRALADAIYAYVQSEGYLDLGHHDEPGDGGQLDQFAEYLAARGVLMPSELTERDLNELLGDTRSDGPWLRQQLMRLAHGEASWQGTVEAPPE